RSLDVDRARRQRILNRARHGRQRALMEHDLDVARRRVHALVAAQLALDDLDVTLEIGEVGAVPGREVVEDDDVLAEIQQAADEVRADETAAARDEDSATHATASTW